MIRTATITVVSVLAVIVGGVEAAAHAEHGTKAPVSLGFGVSSGDEWAQADTTLRSRSLLPAHWTDYSIPGMPVIGLKPVLEGKAEVAYLDPSCASHPEPHVGVVTLSVQDGRVVALQASACPRVPAESGLSKADEERARLCEEEAGGIAMFDPPMIDASGRSVPATYRSCHVAGF